MEGYVAFPQGKIFAVALCNHKGMASLFTSTP
jgi:hypothetical protein